MSFGKIKPKIFNEKMLSLIGRKKALFTHDISKNEEELCNVVSSSRFLVLGGAGSISQTVTKEIFKRNPAKLLEGM